MLESADYDNDGKVTIDDFMYLMKVGGLVWKLKECKYQCNMYAYEVVYYSIIYI